MGEPARQVGVLTYLAEDGRGRGARFRVFLLYAIVMGFAVALYEALNLWKDIPLPILHYSGRLARYLGLPEVVRGWLQFLDCVFSGSLYAAMGVGAVQACFGRRKKF